MKILKKILRIAFFVLLFGVIIFLLAFSEKKEDESLCKGVNIKILRDASACAGRSEENFFVEEEDIRQMLVQHIGTIENTSLQNIDVNYLERLLYSNPWVARAEVFLAIDGMLNVEIEQRQPILRVINFKGESFYIDSQGKLMVWSPKFTSRVLVASGNIREYYDGWYKTGMDDIINNDTLKTLTVLDDLYALTKFILADEFWTSQVEQIYVNAKNEIELVPKVGNHKIIFGPTEYGLRIAEGNRREASEIEEKFKKLKIFYTEGLNYTGWNQYDTLNLKFQNQVVCTKLVGKEQKTVNSKHQTNMPYAK